MIHLDKHPQANEIVRVQFKGGHPQLPNTESESVEFRVEDWYDRIGGDNGCSWMYKAANPATMVYGIRAGFNELPIDDEVVYGKVGTMGHIVHVSEIL